VYSADWDWDWDEDFWDGVKIERIGCRHYVVLLETPRRKSMNFRDVYFADDCKV
jgi:hypothetical protein